MRFLSILAKRVKTRVPRKRDERSGEKTKKGQKRTNKRKKKIVFVITWKQKKKTISRIK